MVVIEVAVSVAVTSIEVAIVQVIASIQGLASSGQERRVTDKQGEEVGDGRAEGSSTIGDRRQVTVSLMPDIDDTGSGFLLDSILPTLLK